MEQIIKVVENVAEVEGISLDEAKQTVMRRSIDLRNNKIIESILQIHDVLTFLESDLDTERKEILKDMGNTIDVIKEPFKYIHIGDQL